MVDGSGRQEEPLGDLRVLEPLRDELQHLDLARREGRGVLPGPGRGPRGSPRAPERAQAARDDRGGGTGAELVQLVECPPECVFVVGAGRVRAQPRTGARLRPQLGSACAVAGDLEGVRCGRSFRVFAYAGAPAPAGELTDTQEDLKRARHLESPSCLGRDHLGPPLEPGRLGPRRGDRRDPLQLPGRLGQPEGFVERLPDVRIASSRTHEPEHDEGQDPRGRRCARNAENECGRFRPPRSSAPERPAAAPGRRARRAGTARDHARCSAPSLPRGDARRAHSRAASTQLRRRDSCGARPPGRELCRARRAREPA